MGNTLRRRTKKPDPRWAMSGAQKLPSQFSAEATRIIPHAHQKQVVVSTLLWSSDYGFVDTPDGAPLPPVPTGRLTADERKALRDNQRLPRINLPWGVVIDPWYGDVYLTDSGNAAVRHISSTH